MPIWVFAAIGALALSVAALVLLLTGERRAAKFSLALAAGIGVAAVPLAVIGEVRYASCRDQVDANLRKYGVDGGFTEDYDGPFVVDCDRVRRHPWETY
jgi:hypothetical protein